MLVAIRDAFVHDSAVGLVHLTAGVSTATEDSEIAREFPRLFAPAPDELSRIPNSEDLEDLLDADDRELPETAAGLEPWRLPRDGTLTTSTLAESRMVAIASTDAFDQMEDAIHPTQRDRMETIVLLGGTIDRAGIQIREAVRPRQQRAYRSAQLDPEDVERIVDAWRERGLELVGLLHTQPTGVDLSRADLDLFAKLRRGFGLRYLLGVVACWTKQGWEFSTWVNTEGFGRDRCAPARFHSLALDT
jgi:hypothetical protein